MDKTSPLQLFEQHYQNLVCSLPLKDTDFIEDLSKHDLLPENIKIQLEKQSKHKERASYFLDNVIKPGLIVGDNTCFVSLLTVMKNSHYDSVKDIAVLVESQCNDNVKGKCVFLHNILYYIRMYICHQICKRGLIHTSDFATSKMHNFTDE